MPLFSIQFCAAFFTLCDKMQRQKYCKRRHDRRNTPSKLFYGVIVRHAAAHLLHASMAYRLQSKSLRRRETRSGMAMNNGVKYDGRRKTEYTEISCVPPRDGTGINTRCREFTMPWKSNICRSRGMLLRQGGLTECSDNHLAIPSIIRSSASQ